MLYYVYLLENGANCAISDFWRHDFQKVLITRVGFQCVSFTHSVEELLMVVVCVELEGVLNFFIKISINITIIIIKGRANIYKVLKQS